MTCSSPANTNPWQTGSPFGIRSTEGAFCLFVSPKVWNTIFLCDFIIRGSPAKVKDTHLSSCLPFVGELSPEATERFFQRARPLRPLRGHLSQGERQEHPGRPLALPLGELARQRLRGRGHERQETYPILQSLPETGGFFVAFGGFPFPNGINHGYK